MDLADGTAWAGVLAQVASGWLVADLITALVHLTLDKLWGTRCQHWPFVGRIIREFHEHHDSPELMPTRGFWASSTETVAASLLAVGLAFLGLPWLWGTVFLGTALCQEVHKYAHRRQRPGWITGLQAGGLLLRPQTHAGHHDGHFNRNFGILNGWSNPLLNPVLAMGERLFRRGKLP